MILDWKLRKASGDGLHGLPWVDSAAAQGLGSMLSLTSMGLLPSVPAFGWSLSLASEVFVPWIFSGDCNVLVAGLELEGQG